METIDRTTRPHPLLHGPERAQLESWLEFSRATLLKKCSGLTVEQLKQRPVAASTMSLLGIVRHMTFVEQIWFDTRFAGNETVAYYVTHDDPDAEFNDLDGASLDEVVTNFDAACARSRELAEGHDLDETVARVSNNFSVDLRWIYIHMIEEYSRHLGHVDLLRELIDGSTGY